MKEPTAQENTNPVPCQTVKRRKNWWILAGISVISLHLVLAFVLTGLDYLYNIWPQESYQQIYEKPWLSMNVRALKFQNATDFVHAQATLEQQVRQPANNANPKPHFLLAEIYSAQGQSKRAIAEYQATIRAANQGWLGRIGNQMFSDNAHAALAELYYEQGNTSQAAQELAGIAEADQNREADILLAMRDSLESPDRADFHLLLGKAFRQAWKFKMATQEMETAIRLSHNPQTRLEAESYLKTQMPKGLLDLTPMARYYGLVARFAQTSDENLPKAALMFRKSLAETPEFDWGYNELAIIYREMKDYPKAIAYAKDAIHQNLDFYNPYLTLGDIALDQADYQGAISQFKQAESILKRLPQDGQQGLMANIQNQIGYAYESLHQYGEARRYYQSALMISADAGESADEDYDYAKDGLSRMANATKFPAHKTAWANSKQLSWMKE
jgi:tetratricopeptide (TPR) repeat protein